MGYAIVTIEGIVCDSALGGMNHLAFANIDADMGDIYIVACEEYELARLEFSFADRIAGCCLNIRGARQVDAALGKDVLDKSRAVETTWRCTAPDIWDTQKLLGCIYDVVIPRQVGLVGDLWHGTVQQRLIRERADQTVSCEAVRFLELDYCFAGCRAEIPIDLNIVTGAYQRLLNRNYLLSGITEPEGGCVADGRNRKEKCAS